MYYTSLSPEEQFIRKKNNLLKKNQACNTKISSSPAGLYSSVHLAYVGLGPRTLCCSRTAAIDSAYANTWLLANSCLRVHQKFKAESSRTTCQVEKRAVANIWLSRSIFYLLHIYFGIIVKYQKKSFTRT